MVKEEYVKLEKKGVYSVHLNEGKKETLVRKCSLKKRDTLAMSCRVMERRNFCSLKYSPENARDVQVTLKNISVSRVPSSNVASKC